MSNKKTSTAALGSFRHGVPQTNDAPRATRPAHLVKVFLVTLRLTYALLLWTLGASTMDIHLSTIGLACGRNSSAAPRSNQISFSSFH